MIESALFKQFADLRNVQLSINCEMVQKRNVNS